MYLARILPLGKWSTRYYLSTMKVEHREISSSIQRTYSGTEVPSHSHSCDASRLIQNLLRSRFNFQQIAYLTKIFTTSDALGKSPRRFCRHVSGGSFPRLRCPLANCIGSNGSLKIQESRDALVDLDRAGRKAPRRVLLWINAYS